MASSSRTSKRKSPCLTGNLQTGKQQFERLRSYPPVTAQLQQWADSLSLESTDEFRKRYGNLLSLIKIQVNYLLIEALIQHWDPDTVCFRFGTFFLTPTLEEFSQLLKLPSDCDKLVQPFESGGKNNLSNILEIPCSRIELSASREDSSQCFPANSAYQLFQSKECFTAHQNLFRRRMKHNGPYAA